MLVLLAAVAVVVPAALLSAADVGSEHHGPLKGAESGALPADLPEDIGWALYPQTMEGQESAPPLGGINLGVGAESEPRHARLVGVREEPGPDEAQVQGRGGGRLTGDRVDDVVEPVARDFCHEGQRDVPQVRWRPAQHWLTGTAGHEEGLEVGPGRLGRDDRGEDTHAAIVPHRRATRGHQRR